MGLITVQAQPSNFRKPNMTASRAKTTKGKPELTEEQKQEIREAFDLFDTDGSGKCLFTNFMTKDR